MGDFDLRKKYEYVVRAGDTSLAGKLLALVGRGKKVLEVGCASGSQTRAMVEAMGCSVVGIEIDPVAAERARPYCAKLIVADAEHLAFEELLAGHRFDVILFADVLEHLREPATVLSNCRSLLAPTGYVVASVPNITHASIAHEIAHGNFEYREKGLLDDTHVRFFSRATLLQMFEAAGYVVDLLDRHVAEPASTEFRTPTGDREVHQFLRHVYDWNPEAKTYQFIVRAVRADSDTQLRSAARNMREQIEQLERELHQRSRELNRVNSELTWLRQRPLYRILERGKRLLSRGRT